MKKVLLGCTAILLAFMLIGCGEKTPEAATLKTLPASGATKFITCEDDLMDLIDELEDFDAYDDDGIMALEDAFEDFVDEPPAIFEEIAEELEELADYAGDVFDGYDKTWNRTGKAKFSFNKAIGDVKGLPAGLSLSVPASNLDVTLEANKRGKADINATADISVKFDFNPSAIMGESYKSTLLKGTNANASVKGTVTGELFSDDDDYEYFFDYIEGADLDCDITANALYGISFCTPEKVGGKIVISANAEYKGKFSEDTIELMSDFLDSLYYDSLRRRDFENLPFTVTASIKFYDDKGKESYAYMNDASLYDIYKMVAKFM